MLSEFHVIDPELMPKFGVGRFVFFGEREVLWGGGWRFGAGGSVGGGGRASRVVFDVLLYLLPKYFFRVRFLGFSSLLSAVVSSAR